MTTLKYKIIIAFLLLGNGIYAQEVTMSMKEWEAYKNSRDSIANSLTLSRQKADSLQHIINLKNGELKQASKGLSQVNTIENELMHKDAVIDSLKRKLNDVHSQIGRMDTLTIRMCNTWLNLKYNEAKVNEVINSFNAISNKQIKKDYEQVLQLLKAYGPAYKEFKGIITEAQNSQDRDDILLVREPYANEYKSKIKSMAYVTRYYKKDPSIKYLDIQIDKALSILDKFKDEMDFSEFLK